MGPKRKINNSNTNTTNINTQNNMLGIENMMINSSFWSSSGSRQAVLAATIITTKTRSPQEMRPQKKCRSSAYNGNRIKDGSLESGCVGMTSADHYATAAAVAPTSPNNSAASTM